MARVPAARAPFRAAVEQLRPGRRYEQQRAAHLSSQSIEQIQQRLLRPVQVLHEDDGRTLRDELLQEFDPGAVQALASGERVEVRRRLEAEGHREDRVAQPCPHGLLGIALEDAKVALQHLREGPVRYAAPIREAPPRISDWLCRLSCQALPEGADQATLAYTGDSGNRNEVRPGRLQGPSVAVAAVHVYVI